MTTNEWQEQIHVGLHAPVTDLIKPAIKITGTLAAADMGRVRPEDVKALETWGLPRFQGIELAPTIDPSLKTELVIAGEAFELGNLGGGRIFVPPRSGRVITANQEFGTRFTFVNSSIQQFAELAWRFLHVQPVLAAMVEAWQDTYDAQNTIWQRAVEIDPLIDLDETVSFWDSTIRGLV